MFCGVCGQQLEAGWKACPRCGAVQPETTEPAAARWFRRPLVVLAAAAVALALIVGGLLLSRGGGDTSKTSALRKGHASSTPGPRSTATTARPGVSSGPHAATGSAVTHQATTTALQSPPPPPEPAPIHLTGTGPATSAAFKVVGGLTVFHGHCTCQSKFVVELLNSSGSSQGVLIDATGRYDGSVGKHLAAGTYRLKVGADQRWDVNVEQPRGRDGASLPHTYPGRGQQMVGPFAAGSSVHLDAQYTGSGNFVVQILSADGTTQDIAFNKVGDFKGSTTSRGLSGAPYYLNVDSDGTWSIVVSKA